MVASANESSYSACRHFGVFLCQIYRHLTSHDVVFLSAAAVDVGRCNVVVLANAFDDVVYSKRIVLYLDRALDYALGELHVNVAVVYYAVSHERIDYALQVAHASVGCRSDELHHILRNVQAVVAYLALQNVYAKLHVRLLKLGDESARESCDESLVHALQFYWRAVAGKNDALACAEEVVEDVEEGVLCTLLVFPLLYVVNDQNVDGVAQHGIGVLHLKQSGADVEHTLFWIDALGFDAYSINKVGLATSLRTEYEERVELHVLRMLGYGLTYGAWQLVAVAFDIVAEGEVRVQL